MKNSKTERILDDFLMIFLFASSFEPHQSPCSNADQDVYSSAKIPSKNLRYAAVLPAPFLLPLAKMQIHILTKRYCCISGQPSKTMSAHLCRPEKYAWSNIYPEIDFYAISNSIYGGRQTKPISQPPPIRELHRPRIDSPSGTAEPQS